MNREQMIEKINKLKRLAQGTPNSHEATAARIQALRLMQENLLSDDDLNLGMPSTTCDDLAGKSHTSPAFRPIMLECGQVVLKILAEAGQASERCESLYGAAAKLVELCKKETGVLLRELGDSLVRSQLESVAKLRAEIGTRLTTIDEQAKRLTQILDVRNMP